MKMLPFICLFFATLTCYAQADTVFVDEDDRKCARYNANGYYKYTLDDDLYKQQRFDLITHKLVAIHHKIHPDSAGYEGWAATFYENGTKKSEGLYTHGRRDAQWKYYYEDGVLSRIETYNNDGRMDSLTVYYPSGVVKCRERYDEKNQPTGERFDEYGKKVKYFPYYIMPAPKFDLPHFLGKTIRYSKDAREQDVQGRIVVKFTVTETGELTNIKVVKHLWPSLDSEAIRVISAMPKWKPALQDGVAVSTVYYLPIAFTLE